MCMFVRALMAMSVSSPLPQCGLYALNSGARLGGEYLYPLNHHWPWTTLHYILVLPSELTLFLASGRDRLVSSEFF